MANPYTLEDVRKSGTWRDVDPAVVREVPLPDAGDRIRWQGILHADLLDALNEGLDAAGLTHEGETWDLSGHGERLYGYVDVGLDKESFAGTKEVLGLPDAITYDSFAFSDVELRLGLRHSNDSSTALYFMVIAKVKGFGAGVTVNGGNISLHRRHTAGTAKDEDSLRSAVNQGIKTFLLKASQLDQEIKTLKSIPIDKHAAHHIMMVAATKKIIPWATLKEIDEFFNGSNAWDLYVAFSRAGMKYQIPREMAIVTRSRKLILELCQESVDVIEEVVVEALEAEELKDQPATAEEEETAAEVVPELDDRTQARMAEAEGGARAYAPRHVVKVVETVDEFADTMF